MNKPLFEPEEESDLDSEVSSDDEFGEKKKKGVKWDAGVVDKRRLSMLKDRQATKIVLQMKKDELSKQAVNNVGLLSNAMRQTKIGFDIE